MIRARSSGEARIKSIYRGEEGRGLISILEPGKLFQGDVTKRLGEARDASRPQPWIYEASGERKFLVFRKWRAPGRVMRVPNAKFLEGVINLRGADSAAALRMFQSSQRLDLLVSDIGLPGLNGRQLADATGVARPGLKSLFATAYAEHAVGTSFLEPRMQIVS